MQHHNTHRETSVQDTPLWRATAKLVLYGIAVPLLLSNVWLLFTMGTAARPVSDTVIGIVFWLFIALTPLWYAFLWWRYRRALVRERERQAEMDGAHNAAIDGSTVEGSSGTS